MSFYTQVRLFPLDVGTFDLSALSSQIDTVVAAAQFPEDVASDIKQLLDEEEVGFALDSRSVIDLMRKVAALAPNMTFALRGLGEDPRTVWVREYQDGEERFAFGPPEGSDF